MRKINFVQGYYEWNVYVDNKCVFTFNDGSGEIGEDFSDVENYIALTYVIDDYIDYMLTAIEFEFTDAELAELRIQMIDKCKDIIQDDIYIYNEMQILYGILKLILFIDFNL